MKVTDSNKYGELTEGDLESFEKKLGCRLPTEYRDFLLVHNGGKPDPSDFQLGIEEADSLHHVYGLNTKNHSDIKNSFNCFKGRIPRQLLPIADDPFGNQICIGISGKHRGRVYFWDHEKETVLRKFKATTILAASFGEFLNSLFEYIDPSETEIETALRKSDLSYISRKLDEGLDIEAQDDYGNTLIERAVIKGDVELIKLLHGRSAKLRKSLTIAERNAEFFDEHRLIAQLITELASNNSKRSM
jgi:cell wall assembly regulator SMI1